MKTVRAALLVLAAISPAFANGPVWDSSGNSILNGNYYFRQVLYQDSAGGAISTAVSFYGNISFSAGTYTIAAGSLVQSGNGLATYAASGSYSVSATGFGVMKSPLAAAYATNANTNLYFLVSNGIMIGSTTEGAGFNDMFVAAPVGNLSSASLSGTYTIASFFPGGSPTSSLDATYQLIASGSGSIANFSISGFSGGGSVVTQTASGIKYVYSNGAFSITFPTNSNFNNAPFYQGGTSNNTVGENGPLFLYMSPDSNFVFGGTQLGFDLFVGVKNAPAGATPFSGLYYAAGIDDSLASGLDSFYGSFNAFPSPAFGNIIAHERLATSGYVAYSDTFYDSYPLGVTNTYVNSSSTMNYTVGQGGIRIGYGTNPATGGALAIHVALPFTPPSAPSASAVYIDPSGIVNTASSAPYTAGISPGDFITFYNGVNLANTVASAPPGAFPTTLGNNVTVLIDGIAAPIYYVSPAAVSVLVPYEVSTFPIATLQIKNSVGASNIVTMYVNQTTPGIFTANPVGGIGDAAMLDFPASGAGYYIVSESKPAQPGDIVSLFLTGLGTPFPSNPDGALGTVDSLVQTIGVDISGTDVPLTCSACYLGLAPGEAGLYQINFQIPPLCTATGQTGCVVSGANDMDISGPDSYTSEAVIPIGTGSSTVSGRERPKAPAPATTHPLPPRLRQVRTAAELESQLSSR